MANTFEPFGLKVSEPPVEWPDEETARAVELWKEAIFPPVIEDISYNIGGGGGGGGAFFTVPTSRYSP